MVFVSYIFLFGFLPLVVPGYFLTPARWRSLYLAVVSYIFYGWWRPDFTILLMVSTLLDWFCGRAIVRAATPRGRKAAVTVSVAGNLGLLAYFKYFNFGVENLNRLLEAAGSRPFEIAPIVLPIGISFYTFQTISYTVDLYRGKAVPARRFTDYAAYVSLFPQLVAGPIIRYTDISEQLVSRTHTADKFARGVFLFMLGFAKKVLIADNLAAPIALAYTDPDPGFLGGWFGAAAFSFQVYYDFSGYSDMAVGLGLLFGFELMKNFDAPYRSASVTETWRTWHISLSTWLRDYLYIPLGGNRYGAGRTYFAIIAVMVLGGLWHGAKWTFICWGAWNALWLCLERMRGRRALWSGAPRAVGVAVTYFIWLSGIIFFRADSLHDCARMIPDMFGFGSFGMAPAIAKEALRPLTIYTMIAATVITWGCPQAWALSLRRTPLLNLTAALLFFAAVLHMFHFSFIPFLYYQF